jgi:hypothetical protein
MNIEGHGHMIGYLPVAETRNAAPYFHSSRYDFRSKPEHKPAMIRSTGRKSAARCRDRFSTSN